MLPSVFQLPKKNDNQPERQSRIHPSRFDKHPSATASRRQFIKQVAGAAGVMIFMPSVITTRPSSPSLAKPPAWTMCDRYFAAIMSETYPNRIYELAAQTNRLTNSHYISALPTIWDRSAEHSRGGMGTTEHTRKKFWPRVALSLATAPSSPPCPVEGFTPFVWVSGRKDV